MVFNNNFFPPFVCRLAYFFFSALPRWTKTCEQHTQIVHHAFNVLFMWIQSTNEVYVPVSVHIFIWHNSSLFVCIFLSLCQNKQMIDDRFSWKGISSTRKFIVFIIERKHIYCNQSLSYFHLNTSKSQTRQVNSFNEAQLVTLFV